MLRTPPVPQSAALATNGHRPSPADEQLSDLNNKMCNAVLTLVCVMGFPVLMASLSRVFEFGLTSVMVAQTFVMTVLVAVTLNRKSISYSFRVSALLSAMFFLAVMGLFSFGHLGGGKLMLLVFIVLAAMFAGTKLAYAAIALSASCLALFGWAYVSGHVALTGDTGGYHKSPQTWITAVLTIALLGGFISTALSRMLDFQRTLLISLENEAAYSATLMSQAGSAILVVDAALRVKDWNQEAENIFIPDHTPGGNVGLPELLVESPGRDRLIEHLRGAVQGHEIRNIEITLKTPTGKHRDLVWNATPQFDATQKLLGLICVGQDVTELKQAQNQVAENARLTTLGEMTTSIAHEINQPLAVIRLVVTNLIKTITLCLERGQPVSGESLLPKMQRIDAQVDRAAHITDHMRLFGHQGDKENAPTSLSDAVADTLTLTSEQLRIQDIDLIFDEPDEQITIHTNQLEFEQVMLNLLRNAEYAVQRNGLAEHKWIRISSAKTERGVELTISDSGTGIDPASLPHIFEPFYTTKEPGEGTGLGLSVTQKLLANMGATVQGENDPRGGARFTITFPEVG